MANLLKLKIKTTYLHRGWDDDDSSNNNNHDDDDNNEDATDNDDDDDDGHGSHIHRHIESPPTWHSKNTQPCRNSDRAASGLH